MFARILLQVEDKLRDAGVLETIHDINASGLFAQEDRSATWIPHIILGPTWMDDLCITILGDTAFGVEQRARLATSVLLETCVAHGVTPNLDKGKSEILFTCQHLQDGHHDCADGIWMPHHFGRRPVCPSWQCCPSFWSFS